MLSARLSESGDLRALDEKTGLYGDGKSHTVQPARDSKPPAQYPVSWLPTARTARAWEAVLAGHTVESPD
jgi:hypothetical protein